MTIQIRYVTGWPQGDCWIAQSPHHDGGLWVTRDRGYEPKQFASEADAKSYLLARRYDLPASQLVFEVLA